FISEWRGRIVNIHPSLLPAYRGLDTHARVLAAGETETGCTVHLVTEDLDAGRILASSKVLIRPGDTPVTLEARVLEAEHRLYPAALSKFVAQ
ncbi:MAG TPA: formyltransferase family protein, partial [Sphingomicrobium sp.]|nr:formyltransferase family protein [Sphingomicrobium sp.]